MTAKPWRRAFAAERRFPSSDLGPVLRRAFSRLALILADEPTGNLDSVSSAEVLDVLDDLHAEGRTIVLITHEADVASRAERVVQIRDGRLSDADPGVGELTEVVK